MKKKEIGSRHCESITPVIASEAKQPLLTTLVIASEAKQSLQSLYLAIATANGLAMTFLALVVMLVASATIVSAQVSWNKVASSAALPVGIKDCFSDGNIIIAVGTSASGGRISRSTDGGVTWSSSDYAQNTMGIDRYGNFSNTLIVGYQNSGRPQVWRSYNNGAIWQRKDGTTQNGERFRDIVMLDTNIAVVAGEMGIYKTTDFSQTFWVKKFDLRNGRIFTKLLRLSNGNLVCGSEGAAEGWKIHWSTDQGESWSGVDSVTTGNFGFKSFVQLDNGDIHAVIYNLSNQVSTYRKSTDQGQTWSTISGTNLAGGTQQNLLTEGLGNNLFAREDIKGLSSSVNAGSTWHWNFIKTNFIAKNGANGLILFSGGANTDGRVFVSIDPTLSETVNSVPLNQNIQLGSIGTINFASGSLTSVRVQKYSQKSPLTELYSNGVFVSEHWMVQVEPPTNSYSASITFNYTAAGGNQGAYQMYRFEPPKANNSWNGNWVPHTTAKDTVNHTFTVTGITEFPIWITLIKNGVIPPQLSVSPTYINYGNVLVNTFKDTIVTVTNSGGGTLDVTGVSTTGPGALRFSVVANGPPFSLPAGQSRNLTVRHSPVAVGQDSAQLNFTHNGAGNPTVALVGTGAQGTLEPNVSVLNFGSVPVGQFRDTVLIITNTGNAILTVNATSFSGGGATSFSTLYGGGAFTVAIADTHAIVIRFTATTPSGSKIANLGFTHNGNCQVCSVAVSGIATQAQITFSTTSINFGQVDTTVWKDTTLVVSNVGNSSLILDSTVILGVNASQYVIMSGHAPATIQPGGSHNIVLRFSPRAPNGSRMAQLKIVHNAPGSPSLITLNGEAVPVELVSFTAEIVDEEIILRWQTATETNNAGFEVQYFTSSSRAETRDPDWQTLGFVKGAGTTNQQQFYEFVWPKTFGTYKFRLKQIDLDGTISFSRENEIVIQPREFKVYQNYPNPFNPSTTIKIDVPVAGELKWEIYNVIGQLVESKRETILEAGVFKLVWAPQNWASGKYFLRATFGGKIEIKNMILLK